MDQADETGATAVATVKKKDLYDLVVTETGLKKKDAKAVIDATIKVIRDAVDAEKAVIIPPLGKIFPKRVNEGTDQAKTVYKLKLKNTGGAQNQADG